MKKFSVLPLLLALSVGAVAQTTGPQSVAQLRESPAGSRVLGLVDFVPSSAELTEKNQSEFFSKRLINKHGTAGLADIIADIRTNDGALVVYKAERVSMFEYHLTCKSTKSGSWLEFKVYIEEQMPYGIDGFELNTIQLQDPPTKVLYKAAG